MKKRPSPNWGGRRPGAGRKPKGKHARVSHKARPQFSGRTALLVVLRFEARIDLGARRVREAIQAALEEGRGRLGFHLVEARLRGSQLLLLAEAEGTRGLSRGIQGLSVRIARSINRELAKDGPLFADHFEAKLLRSQKDLEAALALGRRWALSGQATVPARLALFRHLAAAG